MAKTPPWYGNYATKVRFLWHFTKQGRRFDQILSAAMPSPTELVQLVYEAGGRHKTENGKKYRNLYALCRLKKTKTNE